mgnify:CR=1 FL=1
MKYFQDCKYILKDEKSSSLSTAMTNNLGKLNLNILQLHKYKKIISRLNIKIAIMLLKNILQKMSAWIKN